MFICVTLPQGLERGGAPRGLAGRPETGGPARGRYDSAVSSRSSRTGLWILAAILVVALVL